MTTETKRKETRLSARTSTLVSEKIQRASEYLGTSVSQFLIDSALDKANKVIESTETLKLASKDADAMLEVLDNPPKANAELKKLFKKYKENVNVSNNRRAD